MIGDHLTTLHWANAWEMLAQLKIAIKNNAFNFSIYILPSISRG
jgi:hypothetical protein